MKLFSRLTPVLIVLCLLVSCACALGAGRFDFSARFCLGAAAALLLWQLFYRLTQSRPVFFGCRRPVAVSPRLRRLLTGVCRAGIALTLVLVTGFCAVQGLILHTIHSCGGDEPAEPGYAIVFGAALRNNRPSQVLICRLEAARDWLNANPGGIAVLSGGLGAGQSLTEAACMAQWLIEQGISPDRLILEEQATDTAENVIYSLALLPEDTTRVTTISNGFHLYRIRTLLASHEVSARLIPADMPNPGIEISMAIREYFAVCLMWFDQLKTHILP